MCIKKFFYVKLNITKKILVHTSSRKLHICLIIFVWNRSRIEHGFQSFRSSFNRCNVCGFWMHWKKCKQKNLCMQITMNQNKKVKSKQTANLLCLVKPATTLIRFKFEEKWCLWNILIAGCAPFLGITASPLVRVQSMAWSVAFSRKITKINSKYA